MTASREELAWAGGLFEGEGSISPHRSPGTFRCRLAMTDLDSVERFARIMGLGSIDKREDRRKPQYRDVWRWSTTSFEQSQAVVAMLWPWLGSRRQARARNVMLSAKAYRADLQESRRYCRRGHLKDDANVYVWGRKRYCRQCSRINGRLTDARRRSREPAVG